MRQQGNEYKKAKMPDDFFQNWYDVLYQWHLKKTNGI